jgi:hypothetical protein
MDATTTTREIPRRARYRGELVLVLAYEGDDHFLVERDGATTSIHRRHLAFLRAPVKLVAALDDALDALNAPVESVTQIRRAK